MRLATFSKLATVGIVGGLTGFYALTLPKTFPESQIVPRTADLKNGETMFNVGGCASCHATDVKKDPLTLGGGHELKTAFGTFVVPNISSDPKAGLGAWTEGQFLTAMIKGVGRNGEHLYPAFPYTSYQRMRIDDIRDLFAYLKSLPAVAQAAGPHKVGFPFNIRRTLGMWKLLYLDGKPFEPEAGKNALLNRGAYLVEGPGHCAECHSKRNVLGGITTSGRMAGGPNPEGKGFIPNISQHTADGLGEWSVKDLEYLLQAGGTPAGGTVADEMADVVLNTAKLSADDRRAMAEYLKTLPPRAGRAPAKSQ
ncbi:MAG: cytochrome c [Hyphomicrobiaceae bacterium]|nr:cytochrome c [Hyphomicrobiaceae bacterium]